MDFVKKNWGAIAVLAVSILTVLNDSEVIKDIIKEHPTLAPVVAGVLAIGRIFMRYATGVALTKKE